MYKKAQGLSITTIIVAVIALVVLVVLVAIFTGKLGGFSAELSKAGAGTCEALGGQCKAACSDSEVTGFGANNCNKFDDNGVMQNPGNPRCCILKQ